MNLNLTQRLTQAVEAFRVWLPTAPQQFRNLVEEARADPRALLQSTGVRVGLLTSGGLILVVIVYGLGQWAAPSTGMGEPAEQVPVRVRCTNPQCTWSKQSQTTLMDRDVDDWPAECPRCKQKTLYPYVRCHNTQCRKWVVPRIEEDGTWRCPSCGAKM